MALSFKIEAPSTHKPSPHPTSTVRKPAARPSNHNQFDSSDDEDGLALKRSSSQRPQLITEFDSTRPPTKQTEHELLIPAMPDRDFRSIHIAKKAKKASKEMYKPEAGNSFSMNTKTSVIVDTEGVDKVNSRTIIGGLEVRVGGSSQVVVEADESATTAKTPPEDTATPVPLQNNESNVPRTSTIEEKALRELISQAGGELDIEKPEIAAIVMPTGPSTPLEDAYDSDTSSVDETTQFRRDVSKRPDASTLEDYERIPVGKFGLAMLKGMGWKEGTSTSKRGRKGLIEAYVPTARPSLLGIGAKPLVLDVGIVGPSGMSSGSSNDKKKFSQAKPERRYVPLVRKAIENGHSDNRESSTLKSSRRSRSRSRSRTPPRRSTHHQDSDRDKYYHRSHNDRDRDRDHDRSDSRRGKEEYRSSRYDDRSDNREEKYNRSERDRGGSSSRREYRDDRHVERTRHRNS